jgi:hypothetical protein
MHRETMNWDELTQIFKITFTFENESPLVDATLQAIKNKIFLVEWSMDVLFVCSVHRYSVTFYEILESYNVAKEDQDKEDARNIQPLRSRASIWCICTTIKDA